MPDLASDIAHLHSMLPLFPLMTTWPVRTATVQRQLVADSGKDPNSKTQTQCLLRAHPFHAHRRDGHVIKGWMALLSDIQEVCGPVSLV